MDPDGGGGDDGNDGQGGEGDGDVSLTPPPPSSTEDQYFGGLGVYGNGFVATTNKRRIKNS